MASRQEEKEQRKREREERERAAAKEAKRKRLLQVIAGVAIGAVIVVAAVLVIAGGGDDKAGTDDLTALAKTADCTVRTFPSEGANHFDKTFKPSDYKTNPPTSGDHIPPGQQAKDGVYATGNEPGIGNWVHTLEHGRILFQYKPGTSAATIAKLMELYNRPVLDSPAGYHSVLMQNNTKMPFEVAAVAWEAYIGCPTFSDAAVPALDAFREVYVDTAPEQVP
ncbi:MAG: DUF3105 domain-containing protein [Solirubrobacteraceae bacterium]